MDNTSKDQNYWLKKNWYYHAYRQSVYSFLIAKDKRVLQLGCRNGQLLKAVQPCYGVGLESDPVARAQAQQDYPAGNFLPLDFSLLFSIDPFDYVIHFPELLMQVHDIQAILQQAKKVYACPHSNYYRFSLSSMAYHPKSWNLVRPASTSSVR